MIRNSLMLAIAGAVVAGGAFATFQGVRGDYAEVVDVEPVTVPEDVRAQVIGSNPVTAIVASPREICSSVATRTRLPERDGNVGGTVAGALIGGLLGNQVGGGDGRKLATVAGAVAGGYAGREVDRRHIGGREVAGSEQRCETISEAREAVVGYDVRYRSDDGTEGVVRLDKAPGDSVVIGRAERVIGYDVTYRYQDRERTARMDDDPGLRLPVVDGAVVLATDAERGAASRGAHRAD